MSRLLAVRSMLFAAAGAAIVLVFPAAAQAGTTTHTAVTHVSAATATPNRIRPLNLEPHYLWSGYDYPDTALGLADCQAQGAADEHESYPVVLSYGCLLSDPVQGRYNLWLDELLPA